MKKIIITMLAAVLVVVCTLGVYAAVEWAYSDYGIMPTPDNVSGVIMKSSDRFPATLDIIFDEVEGAEKYRVVIHEPGDMHIFVTESTKLQVMEGTNDWLKLGGDYVVTVQAMAEDGYGMISEPVKVMSVKIPKITIPKFSFKLNING